jgi:hypothetical protein
LECISLDKSVDLDLIAESVVKFFQEKEFEIVVQTETQCGYEISAENSPHYKMRGQIIVNIERKLEETLIALRMDADVNAGYLRYSIVGTIMFGGGYFFLKEIRNREAWVKFKKDFWTYIKRVIK